MDTKTLLEDYERRCNTLCTILELKTLANDGRIRLNTKLCCYQSFMAELNRVLNSQQNT